MDELYDETDVKSFIKSCGTIYILKDIMLECEKQVKYLDRMNMIEADKFSSK